MQKQQEILIGLLRLAVIVAAATLLGKGFVILGFPETNIVVIYLLAVLLTARFTSGYQYGVLSAMVSLLCFNYFFTEPYHTLSVDDPSYLITFTIMLITSLLTSALTTKEKLLTKEANEKGEAMYIQQVGEEQIHRNISEPEELRRRFSNLRTESVREEDGWYYPINGSESLLGIVKIEKNVPEEELESKKNLLHSVLENISMAMERIEVTVARIKDRENMERERERANLLRAISHDLRTPLSGIMGTSEMLIDMTKKDDRRQELLRGIYQDADWLKSLVENILSLTRLQDGKILIHKEMEAIEEVIGCAVAHIERSYPDREIQVEIPDDFRLVPMDAKLIEQVITNLLDNAIKHTKKEEMITVCAAYENQTLLIIVRDEGEGIAQEDIPNLFQIFYTSKTRSADGRRGIGLGLTICETVIKAHGGTIVGRNRTDRKGAEFLFTLPFTKGEESNV